MTIRKALFLTTFCLCLAGGSFAMTASVAAAAPVSIVQTVGNSVHIVNTAPVLAQSNSESSSSGGRVSGRGVRGLAKLAIFAVVALLGVGKWLLGKFFGGE